MVVVGGLGVVEVWVWVRVWVRFFVGFFSGNIERLSLVFKVFKGFIFCYF